MSSSAQGSMTYLLLVYQALDAAAATPRGEDFATWPEATQAMAEAGVLVAGDALHSVETATTVKVRGGQLLLVDGPFAETKEHLIGYYCIRVAHLDEAISWAERLPGARIGSIEVRPVMHSPASAQAFLQ
jgi:hypothetical protein